MRFLCSLYGIFVGFLCTCYMVSIGFLWDFHDMSMIIFVGFLCNCYRVSIGFLEDFHDMSMVFLLDFYGVSMGFFDILMHPSGISMMFFLIFLWASFGISMDFPRGSYRSSIGFS